MNITKKITVTMVIAIASLFAASGITSILYLLNLTAKMSKQEKIIMKNFLIVWLNQKAKRDLHLKAK